MARHAWLETYIRVVEQLSERIGLLEQSKETLKQRYALIKGETDRQQLIEWKADLDMRVEGLAKTLFFQQRFQTTVHSQVALLEKTLAEKPPKSKLRPHIKAHIDAYKRLAERVNEHILALLDAILIDQRLDDELDLQLKQVSLPVRILAFMMESRQIGAVMIVLGTILLALFVVFVLNRLLKAVVKKTSFSFDDVLLKTVDRPVFFTILLAGLLTAAKWSPLGAPFDFIVSAVLKTLLIFIWSMAFYRIINQFAKHLLETWRRRGRQGNEMIIMTGHLARLVVIVGAAFLVLSTWDINITPLLASAGIAGVAVALAAKETLSNFFGGISLMFDQPFKTGDYIILDSGERGEVMQIGMRSTRILTRDEIMISIPNSVITNAKIINESAPLPRFRVRVKIGVAYGSDIKQVEEVLLKVAKNNRMVVPKPDPRVRFRRFGDSSLDFELLCWGHSPEQKGKLIHNLNSEVYMAFEKAGIVIPFPQRDVYLRSIAEEQKPDDPLLEST
jgi:small-conductance mechanosensitive channel